jgi:hypothetical protein
MSLLELMPDEGGGAKPAPKEPAKDAQEAKGKGKGGGNKAEAKGQAKSEARASKPARSAKPKADK